MKKLKNRFLQLMGILACAMMSSMANAAAAPADLNSIGGQVYNLFFNEAYNSGVAYIVAGGLLVFGFMQIKQNWKEALGYAIGAGGVATLPNILTALGASI